jgi:hypothetical protein
MLGDCIEAMMEADRITQQPQTQASLTAQMVVLKMAANRLGLYDAADAIGRRYLETVAGPDTDTRI